MRVNRLAVLAMGVVLLSGPNLLAQYGGHGGGGGHRGSPGAAGAGTSDTELTDFNRALALQATPDQASHFQELTRNTETARKLVQELVQASTKADSATAWSQRTKALKDAVEEADGGTQDFVKSFSKSQKAGLKELTRKLGKVDAEVAKQWKALDQKLGEAKPDQGAISAAADLLEKALTELQSQQTSLGTEMGIETSSAKAGG
jgi:hypothetical protein